MNPHFNNKMGCAVGIDESKKKNKQEEVHKIELKMNDSEIKIEINTIPGTENKVQENTEIAIRPKKLSQDSLKLPKKSKTNKKINRPSQFRSLKSSDSNIEENRLNLNDPKEALKSMGYEFQQNNGEEQENYNIIKHISLPFEDDNVSKTNKLTTNEGDYGVIKGFLLNSGRPTSNAEVSWTNTQILDK